MPERALVVVPTYNERVNLPLIVPQILAQDPRLEILVVDDNSPDGTGALADQLAEAEPRVHVLHRPGKSGLGKAYLAGFQWALERGYDLMFEMEPIKQLVRNRQMALYEHHGFWQSMDTYRDYSYLNILAEKNQCPWMVWD